MKRESFVFYRSFFDSIKELDPMDQVQIYNAIFNYQFEGKLIELNGICKSIFTLIIPQLEANNKKYQNGCKGGRPKNNQNETKIKPKNNQNETKIKPNDNVNDNVNVNDNDNVYNNLNEFKLYNNFNCNVECEEITQNHTKCNRKSSFNINGKNYCNQHARKLIPNVFKEDIKNNKIQYYENEELNNLFNEFLEVRKKIKAVNSERAINTLINKLSNYDDETKFKMIEQSIVNSWKDVYEVKGKKELKPEWFNTKIENKTATIEEQNEIKELLKDYI